MEFTLICFFSSQIRTSPGARESFLRFTPPERDIDLLSIIHWEHTCCCLETVVGLSLEMHEYIFDSAGREQWWKQSEGRWWETQKHRSGGERGWGDVRGTSRPDGDTGTLSQPAACALQSSVDLTHFYGSFQTHHLQELVTKVCTEQKTKVVVVTITFRGGKSTKK